MDFQIWLEQIYDKLNDYIKKFDDKPKVKEILMRRIEDLIVTGIKEMENYKSQLEDFTVMLESQVEELSRTYEELSTVLEISRVIYAYKDPKSAIDHIVREIKKVIPYEEIAIGEFVDFPEMIEFQPLHIDIKTLDFESIVDILKTYMKKDSPKTVLKEYCDITGKNIPFILVPIVSRVKVWGFILLYGKKNSVIFTAGDKKIIEAVAEQLAFGFDTINYFKEQMEKQRIMEQLRIAKEIQQALLPQELPKLKNIKIAAYYNSAYDVGGDYYDVIKLSNDRVLALMADVSGKGVPAALIMSSMRSVIRSYIRKRFDLGEMVKFVNDFLSANIPEDRFITAAFALADSKRRNVKIVNAGHNPIFVNIDGEIKSYDPTDMPLGIMGNIDYQVVEVNYNSNATFLIYTDGVSEARNVEKEEYGLDRLFDLFKKVANSDGDAILRRILVDLEEFVGDAPQHDDTTLMVLQTFEDNFL